MHQNPNTKMEVVKQEAFKVNGNSNRPDVNFNAETGILELSGRSILENAGKFYEPIEHWIEAYLCHPAEHTVFKMKLEYFNTTTSKFLLALLERLELLYKAGKNIEIHWYYIDPEMGELGEDYQNMVQMPFRFFDSL
jgi:hypothetical protein